MGKALVHGKVPEDKNFTHISKFTLYFSAFYRFWTCGKRKKLAKSLEITYGYSVAFRKSGSGNLVTLQSGKKSKTSNFMHILIGETWLFISTSVPQGITKGWTLKL